MTTLCTMSGALPAITSDSASQMYVDIGYDSGSDVGSDYELPWSNYWNSPKTRKNCCNNEPLKLIFSSEPVDDHVYDIGSSPPTSPTNTSSSRFPSLRRHSRKISEISHGKYSRKLSEISLISIFHRRRGSSKARPSIDTQTTTPSRRFSHVEECHNCPIQEAPYPCFLKQYVEYAASGRSIEIPRGISPSVTEIEALAREQLVRSMKRNRVARSEGDIRPKGKVRRMREAAVVREAYEAQGIEERYAKYVEVQRVRREEAAMVQSGFREWSSGCPYEVGKPEEQFIEGCRRLVQPKSFDSIGSRISPTQET